MLILEVSLVPNYNHFHILRLHVITNFPCNNKWNEAHLLVLNMYIQVASRGANRLEALDPRKLGKVRKISKVHGVIS